MLSKKVNIKNCSVLDFFEWIDTLCENHLVKDIDYHCVVTDFSRLLARAREGEKISDYNLDFEFFQNTGTVKDKVRGYKVGIRINDKGVIYLLSVHDILDPEDSRYFLDDHTTWIDCKRGLSIKDNGNGKVTFTGDKRSFTVDNLYAPVNTDYFQITAYYLPRAKTKEDYWEDNRYNYELGDILVAQEETPDDWGAVTPTEFLKIVKLYDDGARLVFLDKTGKTHNDSWSPYRGLHHGTVYPQVDKEVGAEFEADLIKGKTQKSFEAPELDKYAYIRKWNGEDVTTWSEDSTD